LGGQDSNNHRLDGFLYKAALREWDNRQVVGNRALHRLRGRPRRRRQGLLFAYGSLLRYTGAGPVRFVRQSGDIRRHADKRHGEGQEITPRAPKPLLRQASGGPPQKSAFSRHLMKANSCTLAVAVGLTILSLCPNGPLSVRASEIGREVAIPRHL